MRARPAVVGGFILGALALGVIAILFFGGERLFARNAHVIVFFNESVAGLDIGAPVTFQGVHIGSVQHIGLQFSTSTMSARIPVVLQIQLRHVTWEGTKLDDTAADYERLVRAGLRAQLEMQSLLTGQLRVDLNFRPDTQAHLVGTVSGLPEIPTIPSDLGRLRDQLMHLPLNELADSTQKTLASLQRLSDHLDASLSPLAESTRHTLDAATQTLQTMNVTVRQMQGDATTALHDLDGLLVDARYQLGARGGEFSRTLTDADRTVRHAQTLIDSLNGLAEPRSQVRSDLEATARDLAASASSLRNFAHTIEQNPNAVLLGRSNR